MKLRLLGLFLFLSGVSGCEAVGPNEIATWNIFRENHAKVVYTADAPASMISGTASATIDPQMVASVVGPARRFTEHTGASKIKYGYAPSEVDLDADFQKLLNPDPPTLKDYTEIGPFPTFPIIDIAAVTEALANTGVQR